MDTSSQQMPDSQDTNHQPYIPRRKRQARTKIRQLLRSFEPLGDCLKTNSKPKS